MPVYSMTGYASGQNGPTGSHSDAEARPQPTGRGDTPTPTEAAGREDGRPKPRRQSAHGPVDRGNAA